MPNGNILKSDALVSRTKIYLIIIAVLSIVLCVLNPNVTLIIVMFVLNVALLTYSIWSNRRRKAELSEQLRDLTINVNTTAKTTLINSPFPLAIIETNGNMIWKSEKFVSEFETQEGINNSLNELLNKIKTSIDESDKKERGNINTETIINNKNYQVLGSYVKSHKNNHKNKEQEYTTILYFIDNTEKNKALKTIEDTELCMGIIMIDNYEELTQRLSAEERPIIIANVEKHLYDWAQKYDGVIIKSDRDRFYCIINYKNLKQICSDKMSILDEIKSLETSDASQVTLSIAFSNDGKTNIEKAESVRAVIDIALGRGGDQAIVKLNGKYEFFGGRSQEVEKRTKVKARTFSHALTELMKEADNVILMGHTHSDMDAIGSCLGIYRLAKTLRKEAKIVNDTEGIGIEKFLVEAKKSEEYADAFITREQAKNFVKENSMLVVTDTNRKNYVEMPELLDEVKRIVVIDHHRRSTDYIENATLSFHEVYASSASELVTEVLEYSQVKVKLTNLEMEALYAGIMLDTKEFTFKTGVRTFEAAAYLRKCGVDIIRVKKWFQSDLDTYKTISDIVSKAEIMNDNIAISIYDKENDSNANIIAAKAADELLTIGGITASFVLAKMDNTVYISGRSIGEINVQLILEKLGGGGHITLAGAQIEGVSLEDAKQELVNRINEYFFEQEN
jgi:c-di-AMP phosphodiesterase-like protein